MKLALSTLSLFLFAFAANAAPYCDTLLDPDALPGSYKNLAPIYSSTQTGWIFTDQMLDEDYEMKSEALALTQAIVDLLKDRDIPLAIMVAPPRTIVAGQDIVDATAGVGRHDVAKARKSFDAFITQLNEAGAIVPNLANAAMASTTSNEAFYFKRDTHWTAMGAAISARALAESLGQTVAFDLSSSSETMMEKGSLAEIIRKTCDIDPAHEAFPLADLPARGGDLLGDSQASVTLVGTSFSNRYGKDFYRAGDALAAALGKDVANLSVAGTGMIGIFEGYVLSGGLDAKPELIVWETPYTESFNSISNQRQLLGALQRMAFAPSTKPLQTAEADEKLAVKEQPEFLVLRTEDNQAIEAIVKVELSSGQTKTLKLRRRDRVPSTLRSNIMATSLMGFSSDIVSIIVDIKSGDAKNATIDLYGNVDPNG